MVSRVVMMSSCIEHLRVDQLAIGSVSVGGVVVGGVVAVVACVIVCLNRVGVSVCACVKSGIRRRIARWLSSIVVRS